MARPSTVHRGIAALSLAAGMALLAAAGPAQAEGPERRPLVGKIRVTMVPFYACMRVRDHDPYLSSFRGSLGMEIFEIVALEGEFGHLLTPVEHGFDVAIRAGAAPAIHDGRGEDGRGFVLAPTVLAGYRAIKLEVKDGADRSRDALALGAGMDVTYWFSGSIGLTMRALAEADVAVERDHLLGYAATIGLAF